MINCHTLICLIFLQVVVTHGKGTTCTNLLGAIVAGEAPESDEEHEGIR